MPYKDPDLRKAKAREYQQAHRAKCKAIASLQPKPERSCLLCGADISHKRANAKFCCRAHKRMHSDRQRDYAAEYAKNQTVRREKAKAAYHKDKYTIAIRAKQAQKTRPHVYAANAAKRRFAKNQATPQWLDTDDLWIMAEAYHIAALRADSTSCKWHVDHVVPLKHPLVCGLHVPWNLQVIPAAANMAKHNRFEV